MFHGRIVMIIGSGPLTQRIGHVGDRMSRYHTRLQPAEHALGVRLSRT